MNVEAATPAHVYAVAMAMRARDREEFMAVSNHTRHSELVADLVKRFGGHPDVIAAFWENADPVVIGGLIRHRPNVASLLLFATDDFHHIGAELTRFIKQRLFPGYIAQGVHRIEAASIDGYDEVHRWIEVLGLTREAAMRGYGRGGETFIQFAWVKEIKND
jgi:hypothetical protein